MVDQLSAVGGTGTQQFGAGGTSTDSGTAVQNPPAGGTSGGEESESQKLRRDKEALADLNGQLSRDKVAAETRVTTLEKALVDLEAVFSKQRKGQEDVVRSLKDEVGDLHTRLCDVLSAGSSASAAAQLHTMRVELEKMRAAKDAAVAEVADLQTKLDVATREAATMRKVAEDLEKELGSVKSQLSRAETRIANMRGSWFAKRRDIEVA